MSKAQECNCNIDVNNSFAYEVMCDLKAENTKLKRDREADMLSAFFIGMVVTAALVMVCVACIGTSHHQCRAVNIIEQGE